MYIEKEYISSSLKELEKTLKNYSLPRWEELPDIELYMDQVLTILGKYLGIYFEALGVERGITSTMINNYVKLGIVPPPVKKKYSKTHLAYLLIVFTLKQTLDMATIQKIMPVGIDNEHVIKIFNSFVENQRKAHAYVTESVKKVADPILENEGDNQDRLNDLLMQVSASTNIFKIYTEKITRQP